MNKKQESFVSEYLMSGNATDAAIKAGYSKRSAYNQGHRLLMNNDEVSKAIVEKIGEFKELSGATAENKRELLWRIAQFNQQVVIGSDGQPAMRNPRASTSAIAELNKMDGDYRKPEEGSKNEILFIQQFGEEFSEDD
ncbi:terminase small subunit [Endozoicomonas arenosclerae]|uniref:terminase small subunit n=1 Tax=Endozoicomonas arenosclerae TaxID=1633495 RepID=UPI000785D904|nr:terminase small subunit [Endozoicomonas arenosclerae]